MNPSRHQGVQQDSLLPADAIQPPHCHASPHTFTCCCFSRPLSDVRATREMRVSCPPPSTEETELETWLWLRAEVTAVGSCPPALVAPCIPQSSILQLSEQNKSPVEEYVSCHKVQHLPGYIPLASSKVKRGWGGEVLKCFERWPGSIIPVRWPHNFCNYCKLL